MWIFGLGDFIHPFISAQGTPPLTTADTREHAFSADLQNFPKESLSSPPETFLRYANAVILIEKRRNVFFATRILWTSP